MAAGQPLLASPRHTPAPLPPRAPRPLSFLNEAKLDPGKHYIFIECPHGVFPMSELVGPACQREGGGALMCLPPHRGGAWQMQRAEFAWLCGVPAGPGCLQLGQVAAPPPPPLPGLLLAPTWQVAGTLCQAIWPDFSIYSLAADSVFSIPFWRHFVAWLGSMPATRGK